MKTIVTVLFLSFMIMLAHSGSVDDVYISLKGVDDANCAIVENALKEYRFEYRKPGKKFLIKNKDEPIIIGTLRGKKIIGYPFVYYFPETGKFVEPDDMDDVPLTEKTVTLVVIDDLDDESKEQAIATLKVWEIPFWIYKEQLVIPREMEKKVTDKFSASFLLDISSITRKFVISTPVFPPSPEELQRKKEARVQEWFTREITNATLFEKDILEVDVSMLSPLIWQVRILVPQSHIWTEQQKKRIVEKCTEISKEFEYLKKDEVLEIVFL